MDDVDADTGRSRRYPNSSARRDIEEEKRSRAALIRQAIDDYLARRRSKQEGDAFGLWGKRKVDGLAYQKKVRGEW